MRRCTECENEVQERDVPRQEARGSSAFAFTRPDLYCDGDGTHVPVLMMVVKDEN